MSTCGCFSPITQWFKNVFSRQEEEDDNTGRIIEIGPPTNFRKEEVTMPFIEDDQSTLHRNDSHGVMAEKEVAQNAAVVRQASKRDQLRSQFVRLSAKLTT